jgi:hypothetical protein
MKDKVIRQKALSLFAVRMKVIEKKILREANAFKHYCRRRRRRGANAVSADSAAVPPNFSSLIVRLGFWVQRPFVKAARGDVAVKKFIRSSIEISRYSSVWFNVE